MAGTLGVDELLAEFGRALVTAQNSIHKAALESPSPATELRTAFSISETEIEVKLAFEEDGGIVAMRPVTATQSRAQGFDAGALSTLRAKILAVPDETPKSPTRKPSDIVRDIKQRPDLQRLQRVFGDLDVKADFVPSAGLWLVDVVEPGGLTVRSLRVAD
jgi:hypothetical protein